jgi:hypothetical protein
VRSQERQSADDRGCDVRLRLHALNPPKHGTKLA